MNQQNTVRVWQKAITIPTYGIGDPDPNPMFLEKRVYQGSSGAVYPLPVVDSIDDEKNDRVWQAVFLENDYLRIMVLPELGGRIQMALDKTNDYHFVYYNHVIKPALVGLTGPWISGGIEFNWPQHHRPNTYGPVDFTIDENKNGSRTLWCHEIDRMHRTESMHGLTLYPDRAFLEIQAKLYNRTTQPQTFLWWANPAIAVDDNHQSIFPPDVNAVMDHGKRDVSSFPIATGTYYKVDYSQGPETFQGKSGTDISRYRNIPVPMSYMAHKSEYDFVGSYDHGRQAGLLHISSHHTSPGKKQWTWGNGEFGQAWDRHLTDEDGPYIELMCGVYTDNQPDFSWLMPGEQKTFTQHFMPYKGVGVIGNATIDAAVGMEVDDSTAVVRVYTTGCHDGAKVSLTRNDKKIGEVVFDASPKTHFEHEFSVPSDCKASDLTVRLLRSDGLALVAWTPPGEQNQNVPEPAKAIDEPEQLDSTESLFLAGQHIEQYRHATRRPMPYYDEALRRDPGDIRSNNAKGKLLHRQGCFKEAIGYFENAVDRMTRHNPNPYDGEPLYNLGLSLVMLGQFAKAYDAFAKATWNAACRQSASFQLARLAARRNDIGEAVRLCHQCGVDHIQAIHLSTYLARDYPKFDAMLEYPLSQNPFNFGVLFEQAIRNQNFETYNARTRDDQNTALELAIDYAAFGAFDRAVLVLEHLLTRVESASSMVFYHLAHYLDQLGRSDEAAAQRQSAMEHAAGDLFFANKLEDIPVLQSAMEADFQMPSNDGAKKTNIVRGDSVAAYQLGNLWYDRRQYNRAIECWQRSRDLNPEFPTVWRNLSLAYLNHRDDGSAAWDAMNRGFELNPEDARVLFELDQLAMRLGHAPADRLARLLQYPSLVERRDDLFLQRITLHNLVGEYQVALDLLRSRHFHPWEGGEGKVPIQYVVALTQLGRAAIENGDHTRAIELLEQALDWPQNLGEGKLIGAQENHVHFMLGCACEAIGESDRAREWFLRASEGLSEPTSAMYYNDQPPDSIYYQGLAQAKLGNKDQATERFDRLIKYGQKHLDDKITIDYFAVSLPDFLVFDADLDQGNQVHCRYMMGLGFLGLGFLGQGNLEAANEQFDQVLKLEPAHLGVLTHQVALA
ncbi:tetratricopeptide repeat protein [Planctomycetes bacterium CA13]|uniref:Tetratricopeptide repeat protein n=1 Tax=Novipirellula herctigrandis TaxID=2527986 RepID=A0A5C5YYQ4_9BACT|nr:tetratricopeptide repeat protein [Planctomycetes bacterium CA13]